MKRAVVALLFGLLIWPASAQLSGGLIFPGPGTPATSSSPTVAFATNVENNSALSSYAFSATPIGTASSGRYVLVAVYVRSASVTVSSVTVGGTSAPAVSGALGTCSGSLGTLGFYIVAFPTGTTASIVVNLSGTAIRAKIATYALTNLGLAGAAEASTSSTATPAALSLTVSKNSAVVGAGFDCATNSTFTWVGLTKDFDTPISGGPNAASSASAIAASAGSLTITATESAPGTPVGVSASFR